MLWVWLFQKSDICLEASKCCDANQAALQPYVRGKQVGNRPSFVLGQMADCAWKLLACPIDFRMFQSNKTSHLNGRKNGSVVTLDS